MKRFVKITLSLMFVLILTLFATASAFSAEEIADIGWKNKIDPELYTMLETVGEREDISIVVWLETASEAAVQARIDAVKCEFGAANDLEKAQENQRLRIEAVRAVQSAINNRFLSECVEDQTKLVYAAELVSSVYLNATKDDIKFYAQNNLVVRILYVQNTPPSEG